MVLVYQTQPEYFMYAMNLLIIMVLYMLSIYALTLVIFVFAITVA